MGKKYIEKLEVKELNGRKIAGISRAPIENEQGYRIIDSDGNEVMSGINQFFLEFIHSVNHMIALYGYGNYTNAEKARDNLAEQLDDIMRLGNRK